MIKSRLKILAILIGFSFSWELTLYIHDIEDEAADDYLILGTCENCHDGFHYGEDGYDIPTGVTPYTDIQFFNIDWLGSVDSNNNQCESPEFAVDLKSIHPPSDLLEWKIRGATVGHNSSLEFTWEMEDISNDYEIYLYIGDEGYNLKNLENIALESTDLAPIYENINGEWISYDNIKVLLGGCASTGMTTYYIDQDQDGWGSGIGYDYCPGFQPTNYTDNDLDLDDSIYCLNNIFDNCNICDGNNSNMDCAGVCFGNAELDDCGVCNGENSNMDCAGVCFGNAELDDCDVCNGENSNMDCAGVCFGNAELDDCDVCNGENQSCLDEIFSHMPYNVYALIENNSVLLSWSFDYDLEETFIDGFNIYHGNNENSISQISTTEELYFETLDFIEGFFCVSMFDKYDNESDLTCSLASEYYSFFYDLHQGANLLSFPYIPEDNSIDNMFNEISAELDGIIGEGSAAYYNESISQWVGSLDDINYDKGYWIKVGTELTDNTIEFNILGFPYQNSEILYELNEGYNLISYIGTDNVLIENAIPDELSMYITSIIGEGMASIYSPGLGQWLGNLDELNFGSGYWIESTTSINFYWDNTQPNNNFIIKKSN